MASNLKRYLKPQYIIPIVIVLIFIWAWIKNIVATHDLKENGIIVNAAIIEHLGSSKGGSGANPDYLCNFVYKGEHKSLISGSSVKQHALTYVGKSYPALYSEKTNTLRLLITKEDFDEYNQKYPDSLLK